MKKRNYCIFVANYLPNLGGVERYTYNLAKTLVKQGNNVTVVTSNVFLLPDQEVIDGINILRMPCWNILNGRFPLLKFGRKFLALNKLLNTYQFDFVIVQTRFYIHSLYGVCFAKKHHIPCIIIEHGTNHFTVNNSFFDFLGHIYEHIITKMVTKRCKYFYGVSADCCKWLRHFGIEAKGILYNAIDLEEISAILKKPVEDYRKMLSLQDKFIITYTGRLVKEKGIDKLVEAMRQLQKISPNVVLLVAGDGDLYQTIKQKNLPYVYMLGRLDFLHIVSLLKDSDIFCLPTDYPEGFPTSVLEAAACHCYIVTTMNGGSKELIIDHHYGSILSENSVENIVRSLKYALEENEYRKAAANRSFVRLCENFTWEITTSKIVKLAEEWTDD